MLDLIENLVVINVIMLLTILVARELIVGASNNFSKYLRQWLGMAITASLMVFTVGVLFETFL